MVSKHNVDGAIVIMQSFSTFSTFMTQIVFWRFLPLHLFSFHYQDFVWHVFRWFFYSLFVYFLLNHLVDRLKEKPFNNNHVPSGHIRSFLPDILSIFFGSCQVPVKLPQGLAPLTFGNK